MQITKEDLILIALYSDDRELYCAAGMQKFIFLLQKKITRFDKLSYFDFIPYSYGPYCSEIYKVLNELESKEYVEKYCKKDCFYDGASYYKISKFGRDYIRKKFESLDEKEIKYINKLSDFIRETPFFELIHIVCKEYPEYSENCIFCQGKYKRK